MTKAVAPKKAPGALQKFDYSAHAGKDGKAKGIENQTLDDLTVPYLSLLQGLSPEVLPGPENVDNAKVGDLMNSVTKQNYGVEVEFIPCFMERKIMEWKKRKFGGGLVARHSENSSLWARTKEKAGTHMGQLDHPDEPKHDMVPTVYLTGLVVCEGASQPAVISFSSTKLKAWKAWNTRRELDANIYPDGQKPPLYSNRVKITVAMETNPKGTFANFVLNPFTAGIAESHIGPGDAGFDQGAVLCEKCEEGTVKVADEEPAQAAPDGGGNF